MQAHAENRETGDIDSRAELLHAAIRKSGHMIVAYSGGIDSACLAFAAHRLLGDGMLAVIADSPSLARSHYREALEFAATNGIPLKTVETGEMEREAYALNDANRCFHCKDELFTVLEREREAMGFDAVAYGLNLDDKQDFRPGHRAAEAHRVVAPLAEAGLTKKDVRELAQAWGLAIWDKPASACLSSRIEYGRRVTPENLRMVEEAEESLRTLGMRRFRVRHHGAVARVEIAEEELAQGLSREQMQRISAVVRAAGFQYVAVDCDGYRSGAMNEVLSIETLLRAGRNGN